MNTQEAPGARRALTTREPDEHAEEPQDNEANVVMDVILIQELKMSEVETLVHNMVTLGVTVAGV